MAWFDDPTRPHGIWTRCSRDWGNWAWKGAQPDLAHALDEASQWNRKGCEVVVLPVGVQPVGELKA